MLFFRQENNKMTKKQTDIKVRITVNK